MNEQSFFERELALRQELIENKEQKNIMISAGAGAGKTDTMSDNLLHRLLRDESIRESEVVAITFTNAATEEMRSRLHEKYGELRRQAAKQNKPLRPLQIDDIHVSTIHSFCASLITQMAFDCELGISPAIALKQELRTDPAVTDFLHDRLNRSADYQEYIEYMTDKTGWKNFCGLFFEIAGKPELRVVVDTPQPDPVDLTPIQVLLQLLKDCREDVKARPEVCDSRSPADRLLSRRGINSFAVSDLYKLFESFGNCSAEEALEGRIAAAAPLWESLRELLRDTVSCLGAKGITEADKTNYEKAFALLKESGLLDRWQKFDWDSAADTGLFYDNLNKLKGALDGFVEKQQAGKSYWAQIKSFLNTLVFQLNAGTKKLAKAELTEPFTPGFSPGDRSFLHWLEAALTGKGLFGMTGTVSETLLLLKDLKDQLNTYYRILLARVVRSAYEDFSRRKKDRIDSNDLLVIARNLLCRPENKAVREYFRSKYRLIYVDEFQDIDFLQLQILTALACDEEHRLREGCLFVVGDPKQAIYRFRGGEVAFYEYTRKTLFPPDCFHTFNINFRSDKRVVDWINDKYTGTPPDWGDIPVSPMLSSYACELPPPGEATPSCLVPGVTEKTASLKDFDTMTAQRIRQLLQMRLPLYHRDEGKTVFRQVVPGDIMVITMKKKTATQIYRALKSRNIPVTVTGNLTPGEKRSVRRLYALLRCLENGSRLRLAELAVAFSPHSGIDKNGMEQKGSLADAYTPKQAHRLFGILEESRRLNRTDGPLAVVINAIDRGYLLDGALTDSALADEMPILCQLAETLPLECRNEIGAVNSYLSSFLNRMIDDVLSQTAENSCVRVMNVHQTKGLQANIVLYVGIAGDRDPRSESFVEYYRADDDGGVAEILDHPVCHLAMSEEIGDRKKTLQKQEKNRLRYVLDTRARVVMEQYTCKKSDHDDEPASPQSPAPVSEPELLSLRPRLNPMPAPAVCTLEASPSSLETAPEKTEDYAALKAAPKPLCQEKAFSMLNGTIMHRAFELYFVSRELGRPVTEEEDIRYCVRQAINESYPELSEFLPKPEDRELHFRQTTALLRDFISWFEGSEFRDAEVSTELSFLCILDKGEQDDPALRRLIEANRKADMSQAPIGTPAGRIVFRGKSDLICTAPDGTVSVIDYKSDRPGYRRSTLLNTYAPQQRAYRLVLQRFLEQALTVSDRELLYAPNAFPTDPLVSG